MIHDVSQTGVREPEPQTDTSSGLCNVCQAQINFSLKTSGLADQGED